MCEFKLKVRNFYGEDNLHTMYVCIDHCSVLHVCEMLQCIIYNL